MIIILGGAIITIVWGLWRTINSKASTQTQQGLGLGGILMGAAVAVTANLSDSDAGIMTAAALLAAAGMLVLAIFAVRALKRPEGGATSLDLAATMVGFFSFVVGSVYH
jgi:hypothetical protein